MDSHHHFSNYDPLPVSIDNLPRAKQAASSITLEEHFSLEIYKSFITGRPASRSYTEYLDNSDMRIAVEAANKLIEVINGEEAN